MNILPGAIWQPVDVGARAARRKGRGLVGHVAVSTSKNLVPGPLATRSSDWHFYLPKVGPAIQYIDMNLQCWSSAAGNASLVAFESEGGMGTDAQVNAEPWTDNQVTWAARILRHLHDTEGVPLQVMPDSLSGSRGFGTHRLGIDPWRVMNGELWSSARGKLCPGDAKHAQRFEIVRRAAAGTGDDMPTMDEFLNTTAFTNGPTISQVFLDLHHRTRNVNRGGQSVEMLQEIADAKTLALQLTAQVAGLTKALEQVAGTQGAVDLAAVQAAAKAGAEEAIAQGVDVNVNVGGKAAA